MANETVPLEFFLLLIVIFLGVMAVAASIQAFLLHRLIRGLRRAYEDLDTTRRSLENLFKDLAALTGTANSTLMKGKDVMCAFDDAVETVQTATSDLKSMVEGIFAQLNNVTAEIDTFGADVERRDPTNRKTRPDTASTETKAEDEDTEEEEELLIYRRPVNQEER